MHSFQKLLVAMLTLISVATGNLIVTKDKTTVRATQQNNYALNCNYERLLTDFCASSPYNYYCKSNGALANNQAAPPYQYNEICEGKFVHLSHHVPGAGACEGVLSANCGLRADQCECTQLYAPQINCIFAVDGSISCVKKEDSTFAGRLPNTTNNAAFVEGS